MILSLNHHAGLQPTLIGLGLMLSYATVGAETVLSTLCGTLVVQPRLAGGVEMDVRLDGALAVQPRLGGSIALEECS